ncbi:MAG: efflux RND transporter permease subunit [Cyclobacteriaceae bacterium]
MKDLEKEFKPTSWSIDNKVAIYVATAIICIAGLMTYQALPKENFPEVVFPQIFVATVYPGASPSDVENLITKPIETQVKSIAGVKKVTSNSVQDFSNIIIEFETDVEVKEAKREVQEAVDKAKPNLPALPDDPRVVDIDISELPIMNLNLSGELDLQTLKKYADQMQERIEGLSEIRRVDIVGALEREIQINVDLYKAAQAGVSMDDIGNGIGFENRIVSGGQLTGGGMKRSLSVNGEYTSADQIGNTVIGSIKGGKILLRDVAEVIDSHKEQESFSRLGGRNVITLNVIKRGGENLINAADQIREIVKDFEDNILPQGVKITVTGDQSVNTRITLHDLINTIIIGFVLVTLILMFFMGATNAIFVGLSVPISSFIAFLAFPSLDFTFNLMTLFSFLLALGIVVDDAIVVIENTHRVFDNGKVPIRKAAKIAAGEVFMPVLSGTLVVLAPFVPLAFWPGTTGEFMFFLPVTLIVALLASLVVAYIMNPVFAADFMRPHEHHSPKSKFTKGYKVSAVIFIAIALIFYLTRSYGMGNFTLFIFVVTSIQRFVMNDIISSFQTRWWPRVQQFYMRQIDWLLHGYRPIGTVVFVFLLFVFAIIFTAIRKPPVGFFPKGDPNYIYTYISLPIGTDQKVTDSVTRMVEERVRKVVGKDNPIVESIIANVAKGASENLFDLGIQSSPHLGKVAVAFVTFADRGGQSTSIFLDSIRAAVKGVKGAEVTVDQESNGPPQGKPINIEIATDNFEQLVATANYAKKYLDSVQVEGVEELKSDFQSNKPEIVIRIDREKANREGISTLAIGGLLRTAIYGAEVSKFRDENDDYPITVRLQEYQRNDINTLMNLPLTFRDMTMGGQVRQVPLSAVASIEYANSYAGIKRIDSKRTITLASNTLSGFSPNEVVANVQQAVSKIKVPEGVTIKLTGQQEQQKESMEFLGRAGLIALGLIFMILVIQFNSIGKPLIILSEIVLSIIGVLIGFSITRMEISIVMSGVGMMALAGIVVRNGILLVEFTDLLISQGTPLREAIVEAAKTRMTPVLLTAMAATLGLIPLAVGFNIDFVTLFTEFNPHIYFGGDNVRFWGPLSWTMIFGIIFGTFLTLVFVPILYWLLAKFKERLGRVRSRISLSEPSPAEH